jgi:acetyl esterase/lipase
VHGNLNKLKYLKIGIKLLCYLTYAIGLFFTIILLFPIRNGLVIALSYFLTQITGFLMLLYLPTTLLLIKLTPKKSRRNWKKNIILAFGLILTFINALPLITAPISIQNAENEFNSAYGINWRSTIPPNTKSYFLPTQFNLYNYFIGFPHRVCNVDTDILYYDTDGIQLYFDVYYPKDNVANLPGNGSIIIKIHGGSWQYGDKSLGNVLVLNKYLAAQGYVVFDIQYGLFDAGGSSFIPTPDYVKGNFTLHDMVYQIGNFTKQLEITYAAIYNANLNSVFIMGGSAGGQLTGVVGLGYNDPYFAGNFSNTLTIKGIIPIYAPDYAPSFLLPGNSISNPLAFEKFKPSNLVDASDPPALLYQGLRDDLVSLDNALRIKNALISNGVNSMVLTFPFAAHASDLIVGNSFSQVWIYYLERFLYLEQ